MKITDALLGEHGVFYAQFARLEERVPGLGGVAEVRELAGVLAAALISHAELEDELLFNRMEEELGAPSGPLPVMRAEHAHIDAALAAAAQTRDLESAKRRVLEAVEAAREHFAKEERVLFPAAEQLVPVSVLNELGDQWAARRGVAIGRAASR